MDWWQTIATCIATLISGALTLTGVLLTLKKQKKAEQKAEEEKITNSRPELIIEDFEDLHEYDENEICDINVVITQPSEIPTQNKNVKYDKKDLNTDKWTSVVYKFKNTGKTQINLIRIATNYINKTVIFKTNQIDNFIKTYKELNLYVNFSRMIKNQDTFSLKICYPYILNVYFIKFFTLSLWLFDDNNNVWEQKLNAPKSEISISKKTTFDEFKKYNIINLEE